jgi:multidrug resistance efflux pump
MFSVLATACTSDKKEEENTKSNTEILQEVTEVKAIGKVVSADDYAVIASATAGQISNILVQEGDSVQKGQLILKLGTGNSSLDIEEAKAQLNSLRAQNKTVIEDIAKAEIYMQELKEKYETSKTLFAKNAETKEKLDADYSNWQQQEANLRGLRQSLKAQKLTEKEKQIQINKAQNTIGDYSVKASASGVITDLTARLGQSIGSAEELGKIINIENPIIEAEVDELFAGDIKVGQKVFVFPVGRKDTIATGEVYYANQILSNKSILYETANESEDRRVRKIKVKLNQSSNLIINAKVDCSIRIR